jgi:DNA-binding response OmpR family regulator
MPALLLVEDDAFQREVACAFLAENGFEVEAVGDAPAFRAAIARTGALPDLCVLDVNLPGEDGLSLARWLRAAHPGIGIVMLTAASETVDRVVGLECGADDYVAKPFEPRELLARIRAILRRAGTGASTAPPGLPPGHVRIGAAVLDPGRRVLIGADGKEDRLGQGEFALLQLLMDNPRRPLHRDWLLERTVSEAAEEPLERAMDLRILRLRRKLERNPSRPEVIRTVRGVGYMYVPSE